MGPIIGLLHENNTEALEFVYNLRWVTRLALGAHMAHKQGIEKDALDAKTPHV